MLKQELPKRWECFDPNCKNPNEVMCKHLQREMPRDQERSVKAYLNSDIEKYANAVDISSITFEKELKLRDKLIKFQLEEIRVNVLILKFVYNWTFSEIADYLLIPSRQTAFDIYKTALNQLKERGYK